MFPRYAALAFRSETVTVTTMSAYPQALLCYTDSNYALYLWTSQTTEDDLRLSSLLEHVGQPGYPVGMMRLPGVEPDRNAK